MAASTVTTSAAHHVGGRQFQYYNIIMILAMGLGSISYGYSAGVISQTLGQPSFLQYFGLNTRSDAKDLIGLMNSLYQAGGLIGTFCVSSVADKWGRRIGIAVPSIINIVAAALLAGSVHVGMFIFFRFVAGLAAYWLVSAVPVLMTEVAPPNVRGVLVNIHGVMIIFGFALSNYVGYGCYRVDQWRPPFAVQALPSIILLFLMIRLPESPRWLITQDRSEEALSVLHKLHTADEAQIEFAQIQAQVHTDRTLATSYWAMFTKPSYRKRSLMALVVTVGIQMCGPFVINNYGPALYQSLGLSTEKQLIYQLGWITVAFAGALASLPAIELVSRPTIIAGGILGCLACLTVECALVARYASSAAALADPNAPAIGAAVAMLFLYIFWFEMTVDGGQFVYLGEIFPTHLRAKGIALGMAGLCLTNIIWLQVAPLAFSTIGWKFYLCFIVPGSLCGAVIWIFFPETRGVPLESIAAIFGDSTATDVVNELDLHDVDKAGAEITVADKSERSSDSRHLETV